jgi:hypothetical protein
MGLLVCADMSDSNEQSTIPASLRASMYPMIRDSFFQHVPHDVF